MKVGLFEILAAQYRENSGAELVFFLPKVSDADRDDYAIWASKNHDSWLKESRKFVVQNPDLDSGLEAITYDPNTTVSSFIITNIGSGLIQATDGSREYYLPTWQASPPPFSTRRQNWDALMDTENFTAAVLEAGEALLEEVQPVRWIESGWVLSKDHEKYHKALSESCGSEAHALRFILIAISRSRYFETCTIQARRLSALSTQLFRGIGI